jgi:oxalate decarboxylase
MGVFGASGQARTFDFQAGDVGYVPFAMGHYIENTGTTPLRFLEMFKSSYYADLSLDTWLALTPPELLQAHLKLDRQVVDALRTNKTPVVPATFETETGKPGSPHLRPPAVGDADKRT